MSDWYETVVDPLVGSEDADAVAVRIVAQLVAERLVMPQRTDCTLGAQGYPPAVGVFQYLKTPDMLLMTLRTNGVEVVTRRSFHATMALERIGCPLCGVTTEELERLPWQDAVGEWYGGGSGTLRCPSCLQEASVARWTHEPPCAFGNLAFTFWNWPPFTREYWSKTPAELIESAIGHSCVVVSGRL